MSSVLPFHHIPTDPHWAGQRRSSAWRHSEVTPDPSSFDEVGSGQRCNWVGNGLLTPPGSMAMTGVALNQHSNENASYLSHHTSKCPHQDVSNPVSSAPYRRNSQPQALSRTQADNMTNSGHKAQENRDSGYVSQENSENAIASYLQIPGSVNKSKGSLAEFAAEITCLFWFESAATLQYAEDTNGSPYVGHGLGPDATPSIGFRKWVTTILSTTQVSKEVVLLALMFIYRLKKFNPTVSGKRGSEFRLLTIALMLGNKFLDDNTYTNKTWAEVSGISVMEIHIMEVEFLSNMRYDLYVSAVEWKTWNVKLGKFGSFYETASKITSPTGVGRSAPVTPITQTFPQKLPSPPATHHSSTSYPSQNFNHSALPNPLSTIPPLPRSPTRQLRNSALAHLDRKRSIDYTNELPPAKRLHHTSHSMSSQLAAALTPTPSVYTPNTLPSLTPDPSDSNAGIPSLHQLPRLPVPQTSRNNSLTHLAPLSLPNSRAMSTVYPSTSAWGQPSTPVSAGPSMNSNLYQNPIPNLLDNSRQHSNYSSTTASPSNVAFNPLAVRPGLSPSYFLTNRSSPYRPVRGVNTLLIPPPSASMQNADRNISHDQMQYQPLSKAGTETRTGPVPYHLHNGWNQSNHSTPLNPR